ncbi:hypothetical protein K449DRAFT_383070 [Hypoxylon sp. EC38]|nr:hypothetical protein K449DRAFT_383070 [Hypoxylon sp. EC38]
MPTHLATGLPLDYYGIFKFLTAYSFLSSSVWRVASCKVLSRVCLVLGLQILSLLNSIVSLL